MVWYYSFTDPIRLDDQLLGALTNEYLRIAANIMRGAPNASSQSLQLIEKSPDDQLMRIGDSTILFLASAAVQAGSTNLAERLLGHMKRVEKLIDLKAIVLSANHNVELNEFDLELQAILKYFQAERLRQAGEPADELHKQALKDDLLQRFVSRAIENSKTAH